MCSAGSHSADCTSKLNPDPQQHLTLPCPWLSGLDLPTLSLGLDNLLHRYSIPPRKIVVAFGWYGTDFLCADGTDPASPEPCALPPASATTAADRKQATISEASVILREKGGRRHWHAASNSSFVSYVDADGRPHQVWCEDAQSLSLKSSLVRSRGLRGVGCWTADMLYPNASGAEQAAVWGSMRPGETS